MLLRLLAKLGSVHEIQSHSFRNVVSGADHGTVSPICLWISLMATSPTLKSHSIITTPILDLKSAS